jgi:hypothetical protein
MKRSDQDVMKRASGAVKRTDNWSRTKREYANRVTRSGSFSCEPKSRQHQSQATSSSSGQKK